MRARLLTISVLAAAMVLSAAGYAAVPKTVSYQGRLLDSGGDPVSGTVTMICSIYDSESSGGLLWSDSYDVEVESGMFTVLLGEGAGIPDSSFADQAWLEISVEGETITPRTKLSAMPYTFSASAVEGDITTEPGKLTVTPASRDGMQGDSYLELSAHSLGSDVSMFTHDQSQSSTFGFYDVMDPMTPMMEMKSSPAGNRDFSIYMGEPIDDGRILFVDVTQGQPMELMSIMSNPTDGSSISMISPLDADATLQIKSDSGAIIRMGEPIDDGRLAIKYSNSNGSSIRMGEPIDDGYDNLEIMYSQSTGGKIRMGEPTDARNMVEVLTAPGSGASIRMFNPQPEPPGELSMELTNEMLSFSGDNRMIQFTDPSDDRSLVEISSSLGGGASILMFNPQPEPPEALGMQLDLDGLMFEGSCGAKGSVRTLYSKCGMAVGDPLDETLMVADQNGFFVRTAAGKADYDAYLTPTEFKLAEGAVSGYVMTSDGAGIGSWQPVGASSSCGVSQGIDTSDDDTLYSSSTTTIMSQSIDCPADGYVLAMVSCDGTVKHFSGSPRFMFGITDTEGSLPSDQRKEWWLDFASGVTGPVSEVISVQKIFPVSAGANTFYFSGYRSLTSFTSDSCYIDNKTFSLVYIPNSFGTVETVAFSGEGSADDEVPFAEPGDLPDIPESGADRITELENVIEELSRRIEQLEQQGR